MEIIQDLDAVRLPADTVITIGKFNGLHQGHRTLLREMRQIKAETGLKMAVVTVRFPGQKLLLPDAIREKRFEQEGVDYHVDLSLTEELRECSRTVFLNRLVRNLRMKTMVVGKGVTFGKQGKGDLRYLRKMSEAKDFRLVVPKNTAYKGVEISSTKIREALTEGRPEDAAGMLGYAYFFGGTVIGGARLGRKIGFPTANLAVAEDRFLPAIGVYQVQVEIPEENGEVRLFTGMANLGRKPTVTSSDQVLLETHVFDYSDDLYGREITVSLRRFIRPEMKFPSVEALKEQLSKDRAEILKED